MTIYFKIFLLLTVFTFAEGTFSVEEHFASVRKFGAVADAKRVGETYIGTNNAEAFNKCAAYCRKNGLTMFIPKGNYGVASTVWLTNPDLDGLKQAAVSMEGSNRGAFAQQEYSANICVLKDFRAGSILKVEKKDGRTVEEPHFVPVLGISNGRQVHIQGVGILAGRLDGYICGIAIGNISQMTSIKNCSLYGMQAGIVFPGIRSPKDKNVIEGNNDLLVVEQTYFRNKYCIVCAGTQPFACEYRNNNMSCTNSIFTGMLITNEHRQTRGSHKFSSNLFTTTKEAKGRDTVYFDLAANKVTIDSCHFETSYERQIPEIILRQNSLGGVSKRSEEIAFTNNIVNFRMVNANPIQYRPLFDVMTGAPMIIQGNSFSIATAMRLKLNGAILIGNSFILYGPHDLLVDGERHRLAESADDIQVGKYDMNHIIRSESLLKVALPDGTRLKEGKDYKLDKAENAFEITENGKKVMGAAKTTTVLLSYRANDASHVKFEAWGRNVFNPPHAFRSSNLTLISNKLIYKDNTGKTHEKTLDAKPIHKRR